QIMLQLFRKRFISDFKWDKAIAEWLKVKFNYQGGYKIVDFKDYSGGKGLYKVTIELDDGSRKEFIPRKRYPSSLFLENETVYFELQERLLGVKVNEGAYLYKNEDGYPDVLIEAVVEGESGILVVSKLLADNNQEALEKLLLYLTDHIVLEYVLGCNDHGFGNKYIVFEEGEIKNIASFDIAYLLEEPNYDWIFEDISQGSSELNLVVALEKFKNPESRITLFKEIEERYIKKWNELEERSEEIEERIRKYYPEEVAQKKINLLREIFKLGPDVVLDRLYQVLLSDYRKRGVYRQFLRYVFEKDGSVIPDELEVKRGLKITKHKLYRYAYGSEEPQRLAIDTLEHFRGIISKTIIQKYSIKNRVSIEEMFGLIERLVRDVLGEEELNKLREEIVLIDSQAEHLIKEMRESRQRKSNNLRRKLINDIHQTSDERRDTCMELIDKNRPDKACILDYVREGNIIELGCGEGAVIALLVERFPKSRVVGVDYNGYMILKAKKKIPQAEYFIRDVLYWDDFYKFEGKFDTVILAPILHEVYSFHGREKVREVIKKAFDLLKPQGILIIRDGIKPKDSQITIKFKTDFAKDQFYRFVKEFEPWKISYKEEKKDSDVVVTLNTQDLYEFLIKSIYGKDYSWKDKMKGAFGCISREEYHRLLKDYFIVKEEIEYILPYFRGEGDVKGRWDEDFEVLKGRFPNTHILLVAQKAYRPTEEPKKLEPVYYTDALIIGTGIAGLSAAIEVAPKGKVILVTKGKVRDANTEYAQGGIAAAVSKDDSPDLHLQDTLRAGAGLCKKEAVEILVREAPLRVKELIEIGAQFDLTKEGKPSLGREGAHSKARILRTKDATGRELERVLWERVRKFDSARIYEHIFITKLLIKDGRCYGAQGFDIKTGKPVTFFAKATLIATGGLAQVYFNNTNPTFATGDGVALAYKAGAEIENMEFVQFHPTSLMANEKRTTSIIPHMPHNFLISETARGEGAILLNVKGERFMEKYDKRKELASRDIVSRAIYKEMEETKSNYVFLDLRPIKNAKEKFPNIYRRCLELGLDITKEPVPVIPAAHYAIGGVKTDIETKTSIEGLYAAGEVASVGVHGANRLASNSLLEGLVFGHRAGKKIKEEIAEMDSSKFEETTRDILSHMPSVSEEVVLELESAQILQIKQAIQKIMWKDVGIIRSQKGLKKAKQKLERLKMELEGIPSTIGKYEAENMLTVALLITNGALMREESRGAHYREDYPNSDDNWLKPTVQRYLLRENEILEKKLRDDDNLKDGGEVDRVIGRIRKIGGVEDLRFSIISDTLYMIFTAQDWSKLWQRATRLNKLAQADTTFGRIEILKHLATRAPPKKLLSLKSLSFQALINYLIRHEESHLKGLNE
ncbi:MAG: L-aspartate oxidase, partial [Candidatus Omnitrophica bacterium]|nr:L-aspartate oxidase [Candidatus Omnitrophota bacterium]